MWHESVLNTERHWVDCLRRGVETDISGADNLKTYALVMAAYNRRGSAQWYALLLERVLSRAATGSKIEALS
jgi:hypothetical protein